MRVKDWQRYQILETKLYQDNSNYIEIECSGVDCPHEVHVGIPFGWTGTEEVAGYRNIYCPEPACKAQDRWFDSQCPGCVGYFPGCSLGEIFRSKTKEFTEEQEIVIKNGRCPCRTNSTLFVNNTPDELFEIKLLDLSEQAEDADGVLFLNALKSAMRRWRRDENKRFWYPWKVVISGETGQWISGTLMKDEDVPAEYWEDELIKVMDTLENGDVVLFVWSIKRHFALRDAEIYFDRHFFRRNTDD
jgi:hypothetical protein